MLEFLQHHFAHPEVRFYQREQLIMIELTNRFGQVTVSTQGATVLSYIPANGEELLWVSDTAVYDGSKPIRGGIPVCWPWFGDYDALKNTADPSDSLKKAHGVVRHQLWQLESIRTLEKGTQIVLTLEANAMTKKMWPHDFKVCLSLTLGETLRVKLSGMNNSQASWFVTEALHTYFKVKQATDLTVQGLERVFFLDKNQNVARFNESETLQIKPPVDRVYLDTKHAVVIKDKNRDLVVSKMHSQSTVVWNPGLAGAKLIADMPNQDYQHMVCVETANAMHDGYWLKPGETHSMCMDLQFK